MPSLLVRVDRAVLDALRARASNQRTTLSPGELRYPDLVHLETKGVLFVTWHDGATLRIGMTVQDSVVEDGDLIDGDAELHDHDITPLLTRLGCPDGRVLEWSAVPRLLPPNDVDLLCYELGLPVDPTRVLVVEPSVLAKEDAVARELLAAVWAAPESDEPRSIYADHLQRREDPRGELIAIQLARGDQPPRARERELILKWGNACAQPVARYLESFELRRGFLARCIVDGRQPVPGHLIEHGVWSTVEDIQSTSPVLLTRAPLRSARCVRLDGRTMATLAASGNQFLFETALGLEQPPMRMYAGVSLPGLAAWQQIGTSRAWPQLRTFSVNTEHFTGAQILGILLASPLGKQLEHLDLVVDPQSPTQPDARTIHELLGRAASGLAKLTLVGLHRAAPQPITLAYVRNASGVFELVLQLDGGLLSGWSRELVDWITPHGRGIDRLEIHDLTAPSAGRHDELIGLLRSQFAEVVAIDGPNVPLCPWVYSAAPHPATRAIVSEE